MQLITLVSEDRIGLVADVSTVLGEAHINIESASFEIVSDQAIMRITVKDSHAKLANEVLQKTGFNIAPPEGLLVEIPNKPKQLASLTRMLAEAGISIKSTQQLLATPSEVTFIIVVDEHEKAKQIIDKNFGSGKIEKVNLARVAERVWNAHYAIRDYEVAEKVAHLKKKGNHLIELNIGDPGAYHGTYGFHMPSHIKENLVDAIRSNKHDGYAHEVGDEDVRKGIALDAQRRGVIDASADNVLVGNGLSELIDYFFGVSVEEGRNVVLPRPCYPLYPARVGWYGGEPRYYSLDPSREWAPNLEELEGQIDENTMAVVLITPNNPTGGVLQKSEMQAFVDTVMDKSKGKAILISDEIYWMLEFDGAKHAPAASLTADLPVITMDGISKGYYSPGWRLGHALFSNFKDLTLMKAMAKVCAFRLSANNALQHAYVKGILERDQYREEYRKQLNVLRERPAFASKRMAQIPVIECVSPKGAFYAFPRLTSKGPWKSDKEFMLDLLEEEGLRVVQGSGFNMDPDEMFFRVVTFPSIPVQEDAYSRLDRFLKKRMH